MRSIALSLPEDNFRRELPNRFAGRDWPWQAWDWKLADMMSTYWVDFAANGDPNGPGLPKWPPYDENQTQVLNFGDTVQPIPLPCTTELEFWDRVNRPQPSTSPAAKQ
jgi:para-nitrobenzyl esterase